MRTAAFFGVVAGNVFGASCARSFQRAVFLGQLQPVDHGYDTQVMCYCYTNDGSYEETVYDGFMVDDEPLNDCELALSAKDAYERVMEIDILPRLKPRDSWVLTPPHGYLSRLPRLTRTPQRGNALPQNVVSSMQVAVVVAMTHRTSPLPIMQ